MCSYFLSCREKNYYGIQNVTGTFSFRYYQTAFRLVFTIEDLDIATPAYDHFRRKLQEIESTSSKLHVTYRVEQVKTDFPQYFKYNRTKELVSFLLFPYFGLLTIGIWTERYGQTGIRQLLEEHMKG